MRPSLLRPDDVDAFLRAGHWSRETMAGRYAAYAEAFPDAPACRDAAESYGWRELDAATDRLAANLIALGAARDARALVRMPSSCREIVLRIALKKAGIIGAFVPMQWRRKELDYVRRRIAPSLLVTSTEGRTPTWPAGWPGPARRPASRTGSTWPTPRRRDGFPGRSWPAARRTGRRRRGWRTAPSPSTRSR